MIHTILTQRLELPMLKYKIQIQKVKIMCFRKKPCSAMQEAKGEKEHQSVKAGWGWLRQWRGLQVLRGEKRLKERWEDESRCDISKWNVKMDKKIKTLKWKIILQQLKALLCETRFYKIFLKAYFDINSLYFSKKLCWTFLTGAWSLSLPVFFYAVRCFSIGFKSFRSDLQIMHVD